MRILITGANGQMGQSFFHWKDDFPEITFIPSTRSEMDLASEASVKAFCSKTEFDLLINCAAYTNVDGAEKEQVKAKHINVHGPSYLAAECAARNVPIVHFSSDYIYHNQCNRPLIETDPTDPESVYGRTKLAGEYEIIRQTKQYIIFRSSWIIGPYGKNFLKSMIHLMKDRDQLSIVSDQIGAPSSSIDLAYAVLSMIRDKKHTSYGVYNLSNSGVCSWFDLAMFICKEGGYSCKLKPIASAEYPMAAERPYYSVMNMKKAEEALNLELRPWQLAVEEIMKNYFS